MAIRTELKAFPTAEGYGRHALGGTGGTIYKVTNLNDSGAGSFREACEASGPRIVVFEVGGRINLTTVIDINNPFITIAGQSALGDGICISAQGATDQDTRSFPLLSVNTHNVIIRHIRFRRNSAEGGVSDTNDDNMRLQEGSNNVIVDHCSFSQANDEAFSMHDYDTNGTSNVHDITIQNCLIGRAYGGSSKGQIASGGLDKISWYRNFWASNFQRNVLLKCDENDGATNDSIFEFINNVIYDAKFKTNFSTNDSTSGLRQLNYINNHYFDNGSDQRRMLMIDSIYDVRAYAKGNISPTRPTISEPVDWDEEWNITQGADFAGGVTDLPPTPNAYLLADNSYQLTTPLNTPIVTESVALYNADVLFDNIKDDVGTTVPTRDNYDAARVSDAESLILTYDALNEPYQTYSNGASLTDTNNDGIPDSWDTANMGGDAYDDLAPSGYTWIEEYLNELASPTIGSIPTITLVGSSTITLNVDDTYVELGATATDIEDGSLTGSIVTTGTVNTAIAGTYYKYYNVEDSDSNNAVQIVRTINVTTPSGNITHTLTELQKGRNRYTRKRIIF